MRPLTEVKMGQVMTALSGLASCTATLPLFSEILKSPSLEIPVIELVLPVVGLGLLLIGGLGLITHGTLREENEKLEKKGGGKMGLRRLLFAR